MSNYDLQLRLNENILIIKVVDNDYNIYKTGITKQHHFVQQFLNENLVPLKEFLEEEDNIEIVEEINNLKVILRKPVHLEFNLIRQQTEGFENDIRKELVSKFSLLLNLEKRLSSIEKQLSYGVILPGYKTILPVDLETLYINFVWQYQPENWPTETLVDNTGFKLVQNDIQCKTSTNKIHTSAVGSLHHEVYLGKRLNPYWFDGNTLEPVSYLKGLKRIFLRHIEDTVTDITPIYHCSELEVLRIEGFSNLKTIHFTNWPKLKLVILYNLSNLEDIKSLEKIDIDELCILGCPKLLNLPNLASKVKIEKK
jgi:hypothetical protein